MKYLRLILSIFDYHTQRKIFITIQKLFNKNINTIIDVGAHNGEFAIAINKKFKINKIISFEPNRDEFNKLKLKINKYDNIEALNLGAGNIDQDKKLNINIESSSSSLNNLEENSKYFKKKFFLSKLFNKKVIEKQVQVKIIKLDNYINNNLNIDIIDILKIDTEGYEYYVLKGIENNIKKIKVIYFEHHFDDMIIKNYNLTDIHNYLLKNNFKKYFKIKMKFRKSFEYIYINNQFFI